MKNKAFWAISIVGTLVRCVVAVAFPTRAWIDELWVVLDPAYRMLTGFGPIHRDWAWQIRDHIPPTFLFLYFKFLNFLGITDALFVQASFRFWISLFTSISIVLFLILLSKIFKLKRLPALAAFVCLFIPDLIHYSATADLNVLALPPLLLGLTLFFSDLDDGDTSFKTRLGTALIVISALIRFQFGIFPAVIVLGLILQQKFKPALEFILIGVGLVIVDIVFNSLMYGNFVFPLVNYFLVNTSGGIAASYGVTPFHFGFEILWKFMTEPVFVLAVLLFVFCYKRASILTIAIYLFYVSHLIIGHKEYRFFYGAALTMAAISTVGFEAWVESNFKQRKPYIFIFLALFTLIGGFRAYKKTEFKAYMIPHKLEALASRETNLTGIITYGWGGIYQGCNYTVFKPIPCEFAESLAQLKTNHAEKKLDVRLFSHVVTGSSEPAPCAKLIKSESGGSLYYCTLQEIEKLVSAN